MKYVNKALLATFLFVSAQLMFVANASAAVIKQDVFLTIFSVDVDAGGMTAFGVDDSLIGETVDLGMIQYGLNNVADGGIISAPDFDLDTGDAFFNFFFTLADFMLEITDAYDYGFGVPIALTDPMDYMAGIEIFAEGDFGTMDGGDGFIIDNYFDFLDAAGLGLTGELSFGDTVFVSEPSVLVLMLGGLMLVLRRRANA